MKKVKLPSLLRYLPAALKLAVVWVEGILDLELKQAWCLELYVQQLTGILALHSF
jgi:hypothetical protein